MESSIKEALVFLEHYRLMEKSSNEYSENIIKTVLPSHQVEHLCNSWRRRKKGFGSFFLNLSHANQGRIIKSWGIEIDGFDEYLMEKEKNEIASFFLKAPPTIMLLHGLVLYFENHGIGDSETVLLDSLPRSDARFGNSANWGKYILSLPSNEQQVVLARLNGLVLSEALS